MKKIVIPKDLIGAKLNRGAFSAVRNVAWDGSWEADGFVYCREYFQNESWGLRRMFFVHDRCKSKHIAALMHKIEHKLKLKDRSFFGPTQRNNVMWIMPSPWWMEANMKRSLFTAFLRAGQKYDPEGDNFWDALLGQHGDANLYIRQTEYAVRRFLKGHTRYMGSQDGWYHQFRWGGRWGQKQPTATDINRLLRRPNLCD